MRIKQALETPREKTHRLEQVNAYAAKKKEFSCINTHYLAEAFAHQCFIRNLASVALYIHTINTL